ncbi:unnamed protein product [Urochloa humidicola]
MATDEAWSPALQAAAFALFGRPGRSSLRQSWSRGGGTVGAPRTVGHGGAAAARLYLRRPANLSRVRSSHGTRRLWRIGGRCSKRSPAPSSMKADGRRARWSPL